MISNFRAPFAALAVAALLCSGCAFRRHVAGMAIEHNDFVAQTTNRQTVLNILRAREREPMHFTSFQLVAGKAQGGAQLGLNALRNADSQTLAQTDSTVTDFNGQGVTTATRVTDQLVDTMSQGGTFTPSAQISVNTGTDFHIAVNASEEFYRGILGPLSPGIIIHYLRQGFPPDLLTHLLVGRIEAFARIRAPGAEPRLVHLGTINNAPDDAEDAPLFNQVVRCRLLGYKVTPVAATRLPVPLPTLSGIGADVLARLEPARSPDGSILRERDGSVSYELVTPARNDLGLTLAYPEYRDCSAFQLQLVEWVGDRAGENRLQLRQPLSASRQPEIESLQPDAAPLDARLDAVMPEQPQAPISAGVSGTGGATFSDTGFFNRLLPPDVEGDLILEVTIRSVEGILYYLGEYARAESPPLLRVSTPAPNDLLCRNDSYCLPIIRILASSRVGRSNRFVTVAYRGREYAVPMASAQLTSESGRSSQTISLVQQLLNLHRSSRDLPFTPLLRIQN